MSTPWAMSSVRPQGQAHQTSKRGSAGTTGGWRGAGGYWTKLQREPFDHIATVLRAALVPFELGLLHAFDNPNVSDGTVAERGKRLPVVRAVVRCNRFL